MTCFEKEHSVKSTEKGSSGIIYAHQLNVSVGQCVIDLELIVKASDSDEWISRLEYLPLK